MRKRFAIAGLAFLMTLLFFETRDLAAHSEPRDFGAYWAAAHNATTNPYSHGDVLRLERSIGFKGSAPLLMRNLPWTMPLVMPLRWFSYPTGFALWTMCTFAVIAGATLILWRYYGGRPSLASLLLPLTFAPALSLLNLGQFVSALPLLGFCLFLVNIERRRDWLAGASLFLVLLKPQLYLPLLTVLALWILWSKRYRVLAGATGMILGASTLAILINSHIFVLYKEAVADVSGTGGKPPTIGMNLHWATGSLAVAMIPSILAVVWAVWRWLSRRPCWEWRIELGPLLLVSLISGYYVLLYDEVALLAALVPVALGGGRRFWIMFAAADLACLAYLSGSLHRLPGARWSGLLLTFWTAASWAVVYLVPKKPAGLGAEPTLELKGERTVGLRTE